MQDMRGGPYYVKDKSSQLKHNLIKEEIITKIKDEIITKIKEEALNIYDLLYSRYERQPRKSIRLGKSSDLFLNTVKRKRCLSLDEFGILNVTSSKPSFNTPTKTNSRTSKGESLVETALNNLGIKFYREVSPEGFGRLRCDFFLKELNAIIEYDGIQHFKSVEYFGGESSLNDCQSRDKLKDKLATEYGYKMLRLRYDQHNCLHIVQNSINSFIQSI